MKETIKNLAKAFIGESQARNRYTFYAKAAKKEGYEQISAIFSTTAEQEGEHAKWLMRMLHEIEEKGGDIGSIEVPAEMPTVFGSTIENLKAAIAGENYEYISMYPGFADKANEEGLEAIANRLRSIAKAESHHEERYKKLLEVLEAKKIFKKDSEIKWGCRKCGYVHEGDEAPEICPTCGHPQGYYEVLCENY